MMKEFETNEKNQYDWWDIELMFRFLYNDFVEDEN
jgi:hypothetical protein